MSVRNLRAMFETRKQESPPERGRSPGQSSTGTVSPRPLSKVRASFVAIEKDGRIGLQRNSSEASSLSERKLSGDTEAASAVQLDNTGTDVSSPTSSRPDINRGPASAISIPSPIQHDGHQPGIGDTAPPNPAAPQRPIPAGPGSIAPFGGAKQAVLAESPQIKEGTGKDREGERSRSSSGAKPDGASKKGEDRVSPGEAQGEAGPGPEVAKARAPAEPASAGASADISAGAAIAKPVDSVHKTQATKPAAGPAQKTPRAQSVKPATPASQLKVAGKPSETLPRRAKTPTAEKKAPERKPAPAKISPKGAAKPRSKSSTRPVKQPAKPATTAARSASTTRAVSGPPSAHANNTHANNARPSSRTSTTSGTAGKGTRRSSSVAGRQRPSIGPPPKLPANDHSVPKKEAKVDEGFLARMMRPTQSYANKVSDKVPTTPPRNQAAPAKKPASAKSVSAKSGATKRAASKTRSAAPSAAASPETDKRAGSSAVRNIGPVAEQTPIAEEPIVAKKDDGLAPETPKTPEREPTIAEEREETVAEVSKASVSGKTFNGRPVEEIEEW